MGSGITQGNLREFQLQLLEKLLILDEFLKENQVQYYLIGGSALGAARHQGFIPWDDDIDIAMSRAEFERFESLDFSKLEAQHLQYCKIGENVILNAPTGFLYDRSDPSIPYEECLTIDIFPMDFVPEAKWKQRLQKLVSEMYHLAVSRSVAQNRGGFKKTLSAVIVACTPRWLFRQYEKFAKWAMLKLGGQQSSLISNIFGKKGYYKETVPAWYLEEQIELPFEGHLLPVPKEYDIYLRAIYGDYMELPPEAERQPHHKDYTYQGAQ